MSKFPKLILLTCALIQATLAITFTDFSSSIFSAVTANGPEWYIGGVRGLWFGFYRGFFHEQKMPDPLCLSSDAKNQIGGVFKFLISGELTDIFKVADDV